MLIVNILLTSVNLFLTIGKKLMERGMVSTITSKGQLTLPKKIREKLNVHSGDKIEFLIDENDNIIIFPIKTSLRDLKGMVPPPDKNVTLKDMDDAIILEGSKI